MSKLVTPTDLVAMAVRTSPLDKLGMIGDEWSLGPLSVDTSTAYRLRASRTGPRWRDGESRAVTSNMRLRAEPFTHSNGEPAIGLVLAIPDEDREQIVGWVEQHRAHEARAWVDLLDGELRALWSLWDAAGRPIAAPEPAPSMPDVQVDRSSRDDRIGRTFARRFELEEWIGGCPLMGAALARDRRYGTRVRLIFSADVAGTVDDVVALLHHEIAGLAPIVYVGDTESDDRWGASSMMIAERLPDGEPAPLLVDDGRAHGAAEVAAFGARLAGVVESVHRSGMVLGTLRPESTYVRRDGAIELVGRGERLFMMPRPNMMKAATLPPWRPGYCAPEVAAGGPLLAHPEPAADVYALGVMLASALLGRFVYDADSWMGIVMAQFRGDHVPLPPTALGQLLARCLRVNPLERPSLAELLRALEHGA